ncbi:MAG: polysaccharide deacetylase family protein [Syntrophomonadaceae bacterium]
MIITIRKRTLGLLFTGIFLLGLGSYNIALHPNMNQWKSEKKVVTLVATNEKAVSLTFDDGPDAETTPAVLDSLARHNVRATFFVVGYRAEKLPLLLKTMAAQGHELGNHSYSHNYSQFKKNDIAIFQSEIEQTNTIISQATGKTPALFRPPGGYLSDKMVEFVNNYPMTIAYWTWQQDSKDWRSGNKAEDIARHIVANIRPGQIIILHDGADNALETARAVDLLLTRLTADGYRFVTMSELIQLGKSE